MAQFDTELAEDTKVGEKYKLVNMPERIIISAKRLLGRPVRSIANRVRAVRRARSSHISQPSQSRQDPALPLRRRPVSRCWDAQADRATNADQSRGWNGCGHVMRETLHELEELRALLG